MRTPYVFVDNNGTELRRVDESEFEAINAVGFHVAKQHTCMISKEGTHPEPIGSGTFVRIDSTLYVATAKHLFENFELNDLVGIYWGEEDNRVGTTVNSIIVDDNLDLAAIPLPPDTEACGGALKNLDKDNSEIESELFVLSGIPSEKCDIDLNSKSLHIGHFSLGCIELSPDLWPKNPEKPIRTDVDLFLNYTRHFATDHLGDPMHQVSPFGMSGGGIWSVPKGTDSIWLPNNARLIAVQSSVESRHWRYLHCIRIESWTQLLQTVCQQQ